MVFVDDLMGWGKKGRWCHLLADTKEELHEMAVKIQLKRCWYQLSNAGVPHYDLRESKRILAVKNGAIELSRNETAAFIRKFYKPRKQNG